MWRHNHIYAVQSWIQDTLMQLDWKWETLLQHMRRYRLEKHMRAKLLSGADEAVNRNANSSISFPTVIIPHLHPGADSPISANMLRVIICFSTSWHTDISTINLRRSRRRLVITSDQSAFSVPLMKHLVNCQHTHRHMIGDNHLHSRAADRAIWHEDGWAAIFIRLGICILCRMLRPEKKISYVLFLL